MKKSTYLQIGGVPEHFNIPWKKSIDEGIFSINHIELNWNDYRGGTGDLINALHSGQIDIAIMLTEGAVKSIADGFPLRIAQIYVNSPLYWGIYVHSSSKYFSVSDVKEPHFSISRFNSGSHLMPYLLANQYGWRLIDSRNFTVVGNFVGALQDLQQHPEHLFLWERFMTKPSVDSGQLRKIGEIPTPWPSFCIVVRDNFHQQYPNILAKILDIISNYTYKFKQNSQSSIEFIASYFNFSITDMVQWFQDTDWNYFYDAPQPKIQSALDFLNDRKLIQSEKSIDDFVILL